jgi:hypothetical protein
VDDASSLLGEAEDGEAVCYLCLDGGVDEADQPLRRDCACRGSDAGFVHLACLTKYAETKSIHTNEMTEFVALWKECPGCHQKYQNELAIDIASKFVSFVRRQYPSGDTQRQVEALHVKLVALMDMFGRRLTPVQKKELGVTANVMVSLIDRMKADAPLLRRYSQFEADAYNVHGRIALDEGTDESARRAVAHLENQLEVNESIGDAEGAANAKANIAYVKSKYEGGRNNEELLRASQELYEMGVAEFGEETQYTISAGKNYAINLRKANRGDDARELLTKLLATSMQVLGPHHNVTKEVESELKILGPDHSTTIVVEDALERDGTHF